MKSFKEFVLESQLETLEIETDESEVATTTTQGVANPEGKPIFTKSKYLGCPCIEVDDQTYNNCIRGKKPFSRWANYIEDEELRNEVKKTYHSNNKVLIKNSTTGNAVYIKYKG